MLGRAIAVAITLALLPAATMAATMKATWSGTIEGYDAFNDLGLGAYFASAFSMTVFYDTARGVTSHPAGGVSIEGGGTWHNPSPITRVSLSMGDGLIDMTGDNYGQLHANAATALGMAASYSRIGESGRNDFQFNLFDNSMPTLGDLDRQLSIFHAGRYFGGTLYMAGTDAEGQTTRYVTGSFYLSGVELREVEAPAPVPLPAAATLLFGGLGALGLLKTRARLRKA